MNCNPAWLLCPWDFPGKSYWSGLPSPSPGDLPKPGIEPASPVLAERIFTIEPLGRAILSFPLDKWRKRQNKHWATYLLEKEKLLGSKLKKAEEREKETERQKEEQGNPFLVCALRYKYEVCLSYKSFWVWVWITRVKVAARRSLLSCHWREAQFGAMSCWEEEDEHELQAGGGPVPVDCTRSGRGPLPGM